MTPILVRHFLNPDSESFIFSNDRKDLMLYDGKWQGDFGWITKTPKDFAIDIMKHDTSSTVYIKKDFYRILTPKSFEFNDDRNKLNFGLYDMSYIPRGQIYPINIPAPASLFLLAMLVVGRMKRKSRYE